MSIISVSNNRAIVHDQQLLNFSSQIGNGSAKVLRRLKHAVNALRTSCRESAINEILRERRFRVACLARIPEGRIPPCGKDHWLRGLFLSGREYDAPRRWQGLLGRNDCRPSQDGDERHRANE